jgi:hypothetical protein
MDASYLTRDAVAKLLGIAVSTLAKGIKAGDWLPPTHRIGKRLYYHQDDLPALQAALAAYKPTKQDIERQREQQGLFNFSAASRFLGMPLISFNYRRKHGTIPPPEVRFPCDRWYYTRLQLDEIAVKMITHDLEKLM